LTFGQLIDAIELLMAATEILSLTQKEMDEKEIKLADLEAKKEIARITAQSEENIAKINADAKKEENIAKINADAKKDENIAIAKLKAKENSGRKFQTYLALY